jgi:WXG100 family type VII secretion target
MAGAFAVDVELLQGVVDRMTGFAHSLDEQLADVERRVARLHHEWSGAAADEHAQAHAAWLAGAREMHAAVVTLRRIAAAAQRNYGEAIAANRRMWG